jgi:hypothetical protein
LSRQASREGAEEFERQLQFGFHCKEPKEDFMKRVVIGVLSLVVLSLFLNATGAYAQSVAKVNVPFAFKVGEAQLPPGCYTVISFLYEHDMFMIRNCKTGAAVVSLAAPEYPPNTSSIVVFEHLDDQYFLAEIWGDASGLGMTIPASRLERELRVASGSSAAGKPVVIALH